jgi:hypothetical protein
MALVFLVVGITFIISAIQNTSSQLLTLLKGDIVPSTGNTGGFGIWILALLVVGSIGYIPNYKGVSNGLLVLVVLVILLANSNVGGGFFSKFGSALGLQVTQ